MEQQKKLKITINEPEEIKTGMGLWKVEIHAQDEDKFGQFEIYSYSNVIADTLNLRGYPTSNHVKNYAEIEVRKWYEERGNKLPKAKALVYSTRGESEITDTPDELLFLP